MPLKPPRDEISLKVKSDVDKLISSLGLDDNTKTRDALARLLERGYDQGYHDARSHYNIDYKNPPITKNVV